MTFRDIYACSKHRPAFINKQKVRVLYLFIYLEREVEGRSYIVMKEACQRNGKIP